MATTRLTRLTLIDGFTLEKIRLRLNQNKSKLVEVDICKGNADKVYMCSELANIFSMKDTGNRYWSHRIGLNGKRV